ncbi:MAG: amidohydrolase [Thermodesulfobacteriota bacterium]
MSEPGTIGPAGAPASRFPVDAALFAWMQEIRRTIHRQPELAFQEFATARLIASRLAELGIPHRTGVGGTGVVAELGAPSAGITVALRADMDALPVEEKTGLPFASQRPGIMHACGHDGHVAMLLGAAALLARRPLPGRVRFLFQPAEEGDGGAQALISAGALAGVRAIFGGHIDRHFQVGEIAAEPGLICAHTDTFRIDIKGRGGHAARPHETVDSIVVASLLVMSIQTLVSREVNPAYPTVVTVGRIEGGTAHNVIAETAILEGTVRTTRPETREHVLSGLERMVKAVSQLHGATAACRITAGYPPVINDAAAAALSREAATRVVGAAGVRSQPHPSMGGEDFAFYLDSVPGCFVRFGARRQDLGEVPAHSPRFDFDEGVLPLGAAFLAEVACLALDRIQDLPAPRP